MSVRRLLIILLLYLSAVSCGVSRSAVLPQNSTNSFYREYPQLSACEIDSLSEVYGKNKIFIEEFLEATLIALSYYPELVDVPIEFKYSKEATTMAARPKPLSMLSKRRYLVVVNNSEAFEGVHLEDVPFNAQIGIIGHELAHIADYEKYNLSGVVGLLLRYSSKPRKALFEKEIDRATIDRGLGWQLYDWAIFVLSDESGSSEQYRAFKRKYYLTPNEIESQIEFYSRYASPHR
ncbi:MAG: hypothetical protein R3Y08_05870 [Rikenellaceae bacterium]